MKLKDKIKELEGKQVKLGSRVSFVYCSLVDNNTIKTLEYLSEKELEKTKQYQLYLENHIKSFKNFWKERLKRKMVLVKNEYENYCKLKRIRPIAKQLNERLKIAEYQIKNDKEKDYELTVKNIERYKKRIKEFTPFTEREVIEIYDSTYNDGTIIVIFEGEEHGEFWTREEYEKTYGN